jgi:hypothetical protein
LYIHLKDIINEHKPRVGTDSCGRNLGQWHDEAIKALIARDLRFNTKNGQIWDNNLGLLERYSNPSDYEPTEDPATIMEWNFSRYINNSASRISRGFKP